MKLENVIKSKFFGLLGIALLLGSCEKSTGPEENNNDGSGTGKAYGTFLVKLSQNSSGGYTSLLGSFFDGPNPSSLIWNLVLTEGDCKLYTPEAPFCETPCGGSAICVAENTCAPYPAKITVGDLTTTGVTSEDGESSFSLKPIANNYQLTGVKLNYPPFNEGDPVSVSATGDSVTASFELTTKAIKPLVVTSSDIVLNDATDLTLEWEAAGASASSMIHIEMDLSHHGGTKGKVECETADDGSITISANMVDMLKAQGLSGFPKIEMLRQSEQTHSFHEVRVSVESLVSMEVGIPGLVSCSGNGDCPDGQSCAADLKCQ